MEGKKIAIAALAMSLSFADQARALLQGSQQADGPKARIVVAETGEDGGCSGDCNGRCYGAGSEEPVPEEEGACPSVLSHRRSSSPTYP